MRIIGGKYRGKKLFSPVGDDVRPTSDRARESIFNILRSKMNFSNLNLLDVFCGSGAFGLEAMSQGFKEVCLIDKNLTAAEKNVALFPYEKIKLIRADALNLPSAHQKFDIIFMDAPYNQNLSQPALKQLFEKGWLADNALIIVETAKNELLSLDNNFTITEERTYGIAKFLFVKKN